MSQKTIYQQYKPTIIFIITFVLIYFVLASIYSIYINSFDTQTDHLTKLVGKAVSGLYKILGIDAQSIPLDKEAGLKLIIQGNYVARIVEGCTAISIIIMFVAFVLSFGRNFKSSLIFALAGSFFIFIFNIIRIVILGYLLYKAPKYQDFLHRIVFPAMIYGFVVLLWILFIKKMKKDETR